MRLEAREEFDKFYEAVVSQLVATPIEDLNIAWASVGAKTKFYSGFFDGVAQRLGYSCKREFLRVDFTLFKSNDVPVISIESENAHCSATDEMRKLCAVGAPVKVLLLSCEWSNSERGVWASQWADIIKRQHEHFGQECLYVMMIGEWGRGDPDDEQLRYLFDVYSHEGKEILRAEIVLPVLSGPC